VSVEAMALVLHHSRARSATKLILLGIANHEGDGGAWPCINTLAKYAAVDPRTVKRSLRQLEAMGEIHTARQRGGLAGIEDHERPNLYQVLVTCPPECDGSTRHNLKA
jgi:DNA-binding MarR family transcriptional regulator